MKEIPVTVLRPFPTYLNVTRKCARLKTKKTELNPPTVYVYLIVPPFPFRHQKRQSASVCK